MSYVAVAIVIGLLIAIHEYGHLLAAKLCGIPVRRFSIGFGPKLFSFKLAETSYWFSLIPLGGYVLPALEDTDFRRLPAYKRITFALGGPAAKEIDVSSVSYSQTATAGNPSSHRRDFDVAITIKEEKTESFDERDFLTRLKGRIVQEAHDSGITVSGNGEGNNTFHVDYQNKKHHGGIEVIGVRTDKTNYRLWCVIRELA